MVLVVVVDGGVGDGLRRNGAPRGGWRQGPHGHAVVVCAVVAVTKIVMVMLLLLSIAAVNIIVCRPVFCCFCNC